MSLNKNNTECDCIYDDVDVNSICGIMSPADMLLSLALECPRDCRSTRCPIKEVETWRKMDIKQVYNIISGLSVPEQKRLVEEHRKCSNNDPYKIIK